MRKVLPSTTREYKKLLREEGWENGFPAADPYGYGPCPEEYYAPSTYVCNRCGWWVQGIRIGHNLAFNRTSIAALCSFDLADSRLSIPEIISHISRTYADVYGLPSRTFEEVIAAVYANLGYSVTLTKATRDGGKDLICLDKAGRVCIVECRRYSETRKIGIAAVDRLLGVRFRMQADEAHVVTTSGFTRPAVVAASEANCHDAGMRLVDAHELLSILRLLADESLTVKDLSALFGTKE